jgi:hypothetical protein
MLFDPVSFTIDKGSWFNTHFMISLRLNLTILQAKWGFWSQIKELTTMLHPIKQLGN